MLSTIYTNYLIHLSINKIVMVTELAYAISSIHNRFPIQKSTISIGVFKRCSYATAVRSPFSSYNVAKFKLCFIEDVTRVDVCIAFETYIHTTYSLSKS